MKIFEEELDWKGHEYILEYFAEKDFSNIKPIRQVQALCILENEESKAVIYKDINGDYGLPGGTPENGESFSETLARELREEIAVTIIDSGPLMYVKVIDPEKKREPFFQLRYWAIVRLLDEEVNDPDKRSIGRYLVDLEELDDYLKWGEKVEIYKRFFKEARKNIN